MNDFLATTQQEITNRLKQLQPAVEEYQRLEAAQAALATIPSAPMTPSPKPRGRPARKAATATPSASKPRTKRSRAGRRKGSGQRGGQALALIQGQPGITIPELATAMGLKPNYLYRVLPRLQKDGKIIKKGRGWEAKG